MPFFIVPYIVRILGPEKYGNINFAANFIAYFTLIINYSFDYTATREISINKDNYIFISKLFWTVIITKIFFFILCSIIFWVLVSSIPLLRDNYLLFIITYIGIVANVLMPNWIFQGMERFHILVTFNILGKILMTVSIFLFFKFESQFLLVPLLTSITSILSSLISFIYAIQSWQINIYLPKLKEIIHTAKVNATIFVSSIMVNINTASTVVILGFIANNTAVGYYTAMLKINSVISGLVLVPFSLVAFPHLSKSFHHSQLLGVTTIKKMTAIMIILTTLVSIVVFLFAKPIILLIFGEKFIGALVCLKIISFLPILSGCVNIFAFQGLISLKLEKEFFLTMLVTAAVSVILNSILSYFYKQNGTAITLIFTEIIAIIVAYRFLLLNGVRIIDKQFINLYLLKYLNPSYVFNFLISKNENT